MLVSKSQGFTLLEVLITTTIISILALVAAPSLSNFIKNDRLKTSANHLHRTFKLAQSEAVKRDQNVFLEKSSVNWIMKTEINSTLKTLYVFKPSHKTVSVDLIDLSISNIGEIVKSQEILISDSDSTTKDYRLCILKSGQSWLIEGKQRC